MTEGAMPEPAEDDPATVGFAMLMVGVESAVASAAAEIAMLGLAVQQQFARQPATPPPAQPGNPANPRPAASADGQAAPARNAAAPPEAPMLPRLTTSAAQTAPVLQAVTIILPEPERAVAPAPPPTQAAPATVTPPAPPRAGSVWPQPPEFAASVASVAPDALPSSRRVQSAQPTADSVPAPVPAMALAPPAPISFATGDPDPQKLPPVAPAAPSVPSLPGAPIAHLAPPARTFPASFAGAPALAPVDAPPLPQSLAPPTVAAGQESAKPTRHGPVSDGVLPSAPARHREGSQGAQPHGDILLDGTRVGQWLSDMMARAAGGPATGTTGFDPRMGPRWPGALQGR